MRHESIAVMDAATDIQAVRPPENGITRFRFSLKWLLLVVAILCVLLGIYTTLERKAREMLALNNSILNAIEDSLRLEPTSTTFVMPESLRRTTADFMTSTRAQDHARRRLN